MPAFSRAMTCGMYCTRLESRSSVSTKTMFGLGEYGPLGSATVVPEPPELQAASNTAAAPTIAATKERAMHDSFLVHRPLGDVRRAIQPHRQCDPIAAQNRAYLTAHS